MNTATVKTHVARTGTVTYHYTANDVTRKSKNVYDAVWFWKFVDDDDWNVGGFSRSYDTAVKTANSNASSWMKNKQKKVVSDVVKIVPA